MIEFLAFHLHNFTGYLDTTVELSNDPDRPLTIIRGENQSGKTTMLRGLTWVVYGQEAMPRTKDGTHPIRPDFLEDGQQVHRGWLVFAYRGGSGPPTLFRLSRESLTRGDGAQVEVITEAAGLERHSGEDWRDDSGWEDASGQMQTLRRGYFRPELREIIFADADKAEEFVGGPEQSHSDEVMERSVTGALNRLLGIEVVKEAIRRTDGARKHFRTELDKKADETSELPGMRDELEEMETNLEQQLNDLKSKFVGMEDAKARIARHEIDKDKVRADSEATRALQIEVGQLKEEKAKQEGERDRRLGDIVDRFHTSSLPGALMSSAVARASGHLGGLKEQGVLPPGEITVIPRVLREGECLCGTDCSEGTSARRSLERILVDSQKHAEGRSALDEFRMQLGSLVGKTQALGEAWREGLDKDVEACAKADQEARRLDGIILEKTREMNELSKGNEAYQEIEDALRRLWGDKSSFETNIDTTEKLLGARYAYDPDTRKMRRLMTPEEVADAGKQPLDEATRKAGLHARIEGLKKIIAARERIDEKANLERTQLRVSEDLKSILTDVLNAIRDEQIPAVSQLMNDMYRDVMQAGEDAPTAEVGVRPTTHGYADREFELFALNSRGHDKDMGLLAGSERRAVATAFLLALVKASEARVPFVSDSLLHSVSGVVRTNLIKRIASEASQAVMFALRSDVVDANDRELLKAAAGRTYTVTNQTHVPEKVVRLADSRTGSQSVLCSCGPDVYCEVCERIGDELSRDLSYNDSAELVN